MDPEAYQKINFLLTFLVLVNLVVRVVCVDNYHRHDFPDDFVFGSGTTAYQVEGAANEDGRTPSIWDTFAHDVYGNEENGDVACDGYHKYKEDVQLMEETGLEAYRFSISWSRLIPNGRGPVNPKGLQYYNNLINELISKGIQPHVTLHNFDLPQALENEYGGWVSRDIIEFGDRVKYWTTVNEPNVFALTGYDLGTNPPQRCSPPFCVTNYSRAGNSTYEPYLAVHHILLSHSSAVRLYRRKYRDEQHGYVGISVYTYGLIPLTDTEKDKVATKRAHDFLVGWIVEPLVHGDYPIIMKENAGARIPAFTNRESEQIKGSYDFIGVIYYNNVNVSDNSDVLKKELRDISSDMAVRLICTYFIMFELTGYSGLNKLNHSPAFPGFAVLQSLFTVEEFPVTPWSLRDELNILKLQYGNPPIFILENGQRTESNSSLEDESRVKYLQGYIGAVLDALRDGSNIKGYFAWSFLDLFELLGGYESSYGLYYVDRNDTELKRYPKLSAKWYRSFLKGTVELEKDESFASVGNLFQQAL